MGTLTRVNRPDWSASGTNTTTNGPAYFDDIQTGNSAAATYTTHSMRRARARIGRSSNHFGLISPRLMLRYLPRAADDKVEWRFSATNWHHHPQVGGGHVSHSHENVEPGHGHSGGTLPGGTYEHPALGPQIDELPPLPDEVIYRIAAILRQHRQD
jgi:hypothetical protein